MLQVMFETVASLPARSTQPARQPLCSRLDAGKLDTRRMSRRDRLLEGKVGHTPFCDRGGCYTCTPHCSVI